MDRDVECSANCLPADALVGDYRILGVIGEGGFGIVYRALDLSLDREVALKEYLPATLAGRQSASHRVHVRSQHRGAFDAGLRSFINEARLLACFSHPTLVHVYRFFEFGGTAYMVMRRYKGRTLRHALDNPSLQVDQAWLSRLLGPLLDVLELLHAEDCFHRDIAPDNIFLQDDGSPVLLDFGAARRIIGDMTQALTMVLKPGFAPIEQYVDDGAMPQGAWTDIYQIGALIYLAITGKTPTTSVARMVNDPLSRLTPEQVPGFSEAFLLGVHRALAVRSQDRPQSIAELKVLLGFPPRAQGAESVTATLVDEALVSPVEEAEVPSIQTVELRRQPTVSLSSIAPPSSALGTSELSVALPVVEHAGLQLGGEDPLARMENVASAGQAIAPEPLGRGRPGPADGDEVDHQVARTKVPNHATGPRQRAPLKLVITACVVVALLAGGIGLFGGLSQNTAAEVQVAHRDGTTALLPQTQREAREVIVEVEPEVASSSAPTEAVSTPERPPEKAFVESVVPVTTQPSSVSNAPPARDEMSPAVPPVVMGKVIFRIAPWGYVSVNQAPAKTSPPLTQLRLPEGQYRIDISNPGATAPITRTIEVKRGEPVTVSHRFE